MVPQGFPEGRDRPGPPGPRPPGGAPLRVLLAIGSLECGGSERQVVDIARHLDRARFAPLLYTISGGGPLRGQLPNDVPVHSFRQGRRPPLVNWPGRLHRQQVAALVRLLREERIDVVYSRTYPMTLVAAPASRRAGVAHVSAIASDPPHDVPRTAGRWGAIKRRLLRRAYGEAAATLAVSDAVRRSAAAWYRLPAARIEAVPNLIDLERIDRLAAAEPPEMEPGCFHVISAGRLQEEKGAEVLLEAIELLVRDRGKKHVRLHLLGDGPQREELRASIAARGLARQVTLHGFVENPYRFFRCGDLFCLPSLYEGLPNVLIEALACGTPVVASDCPGGTREVLADGAHGRLVPPGDAAALADAIGAAIDAAGDRSGAGAEAAAARRHIESHYALQVGIRRLEDILARAARGEPRGDASR